MKNKRICKVEDLRGDDPGRVLGAAAAGLVIVTLISLSGPLDTGHPQTLDVVATEAPAVAHGRDLARSRALYRATADDPACAITLANPNLPSTWVRRDTISGACNEAIERLAI